MRSYLQEDEDNKIILALDSTSISSYSTRLTHIEYGKNKDDDALPQLNVLFLVDQKSGLPIFYRFYDGNVPDVSTIRHTIADQALLNMKNVVLVADKGYNSVKNINDCLINKVSSSLMSVWGLKAVWLESLSMNTGKSLQTSTAAILTSGRTSPQQK